MIRRLLPAAVLVAVLAQGGTAADNTTPPPGAWVFKALNGLDVSQKVGDVSEVRGARIRYEGLALTAHALTYVLMTWPDSTLSVIRKLDLTSAEAADDRLEIDTREAISPTIGFRGTLRPRTTRVHVLEPDPSMPGKVRYRADLAQVGAFRGLMKDERLHTWVPHQGWADHAELWFSARLDAGEGGIKDLKIDVVVLYSEPAQPGGQPGRRVELDRWKGPENPSEGEWPATGIAGHLDARKVIITMTDDGTAKINGDDLSTWGSVIPSKQP